MNHLIDFGVCALAGCTNFIIYIIPLKKDILSAFWCSNLMLHSKSQSIRRKTKRNVQYCQTVKWDKRA